VTSGRRDRGAAGLEQVGAIAIASTIVLTLGAVLIPAAQPIRAAAACGVHEVLGDVVSCPTQTLQIPADNSTRRGAAGDARGSRRDDATGRRGGTEPQPSGTAAVPGGPELANGLGGPVPGTTARVPDPPPWTAPDGGAGPHAVKGAGIKDRATAFAVEAAANAVSGVWPHASRNLLHYLGNSGSTLQQDVNAMLKDDKSFAGDADAQRQRVAALAVEQAKASGATGPVTFPISLPWQGFTFADKDWFYAVGSIAYSVVGQVTVYPPTAPGQPWNYEATTSVVIRDRYNWDQGKSTDIGPFNVSDSELARLHTVGLAQEYTVVGTSTATTTKGTSP
jgi:hypothetical protein